MAVSHRLESMKTLHPGGARKGQEVPARAQKKQGKAPWLLLIKESLMRGIHRFSLILKPMRNCHIDHPCPKYAPKCSAKTRKACTHTHTCAHTKANRNRNTNRTTGKVFDNCSSETDTTTHNNTQQYTLLRFALRVLFLCDRNCSNVCRRYM